MIACVSQLAVGVLLDRRTPADEAAPSPDATRPESASRLLNLNRGASLCDRRQAVKLVAGDWRRGKIPFHCDFD